MSGSGRSEAALPGGHHPRPAPGAQAQDLLDTFDAGPAAIRGGALRGSGYLVGVLLTLVSVPLMARHLGPDDFGLYVTVIALISVVALLVNGGIITIGLREYATGDPGSRPGLLRAVLGMRMTFSFAGLVAALMFSAANYSDTLVAGTLIAGVGMIALDLRRVCTVPLEATLRFGRVSAVELTQQVTLVGIIVFLIVAGAGLVAFFAAGAVAAAAGLVAALVLGRGAGLVTPSFAWGAWKPMLRGALPYAVAVAFGGVSYRLTVIFMSLLTSERETGYFVIPFRIFEVAAGIATVLLLSAFPIVARSGLRDPQRLRYVLQRTFEVALIVSVGIALAAIVGAEFIIRILGGAEYEAAVPVLQTLAVAVVAAFLFLTWEYALLALKRHGFLLVANGLSLGVALVVTPPLIAAWGAQGAALALVAIELAGMCACGALLMRSYPHLRVSPSIVPRAVLAVALAALAAALVPVPSAVTIVIALLVYSSMLLALKAMPVELLDALPKRRREEQA